MCVWKTFLKQHEIKTKRLLMRLEDYYWDPQVLKQIASHRIVQNFQNIFLAKTYYWKVYLKRKFSVKHFIVR